MKYKEIYSLLIGVSLIGIACQKTTTAPAVSGVAALTVVNAIPNSGPVVPVINTSGAIMYFSSAQVVGYGGSYEYSPVAGNDTVYVVQDNSDTANIGPKVIGLMYYNILGLKKSGIYSLFLCGTDTTSPDYLFTTDTLAYYPPSDSVMGIRLVNLSTGSNPISINLEGNANGSEVGSLPYKGITGFKTYPCNSTTNDYFFVIRDAATGDSLTQFDFGSQNNGYGLVNIYNGGLLLTFRNVTIAVYGSETDMNNPLNTMLINNY